MREGLIPTLLGSAVMASGAMMRGKEYYFSNPML